MASLPTVEISSLWPAIPSTKVEKINGTTIILIIRMKAVPKGSISCANPGWKYPIMIPTKIPTKIQNVKLVHRARNRQTYAHGPHRYLFQTIRPTRPVLTAQGEYEAFSSWTTRSSCLYTRGWPADASLWLTKSLMRSIQVFPSRLCDICVGK